MTSLGYLLGIALCCCAILLVARQRYLILQAGRPGYARAPNMKRR